MTLAEMRKENDALALEIIDKLGKINERITNTNELLKGLGKDEG